MHRAFPGVLSRCGLSYYQESMTVNHIGQHVWCMPRSLDVRDLFCRFREKNRCSIAAAKDQIYRPFDISSYYSRAVKRRCQIAHSSSISVYFYILLNLFLCCMKCMNHLPLDVKQTTINPTIENNQLFQHDSSFHITLSYTQPSLRQLNEHQIIPHGWNSYTSKNPVIKRQN